MNNQDTFILDDSELKDVYFIDKKKDIKSIDATIQTILTKAGFDPNQERDSFGRFGSGEGDTKLEDRPCFKEWNKGNKMVDENGTPKEFYHGTTFDFDEFSKERGNIENDFGIGFYFSSSLDDVESNYDDLQGPDLVAKIEKLAERIASDEDLEYDDPDVIARATEQLSGGKNRIINTYLSIKEPFVLGGDDETYFEYNYDEDEGESGTYINFIESFRNVSRKYDDVDADQAINDMFEGAGYDSGSATSVMAALRKSEGLQYATDENGNLAGNEILRATLEDMGFDAIVDNNVNKKFGSARQFGQAMDGIYGDTQHVIAFEPGQIKETDAKSFCDKTKINKSIADIIFEKAGFKPEQIHKTRV